MLRLYFITTHDIFNAPRFLLEGFKSKGVSVQVKELTEEDSGYYEIIKTGEGLAQMTS